ncbi:hypothetical protein ACH5RR_007912 [Cinchona calisaya]|uniref:Uncharacterized protein n=1 Tax=Cinchona calisaya TaxID=153742 RepID=A0ABD3A9W8_9GENT
MLSYQPAQKPIQECEIWNLKSRVEATEAYKSIGRLSKNVAALVDALEEVKPGNRATNALVTAALKKEVVFPVIPRPEYTKSSTVTLADSCKSNVQGFLGLYTSPEEKLQKSRRGNKVEGIIEASLVH